jgi:uncharacterized protein YcbK (DUF882 family)
MKYTVAVNLNKLSIDWQSDFEKVKQYYLKHNVELSFIFTQTDIKGYTSQYDPATKRYLVFGTHNMVKINPTTDVNMIVLNQMEWATPAGSQFPLKPETPSGCTYQFGTKPYIVVCTSQFDESNGENWIQIAHELLHSLRITANIKGYPVVDVLDTYRENSNPDSPTGNFTEQWGLLQEFINKPNTIQPIYKYFSAKEIVGLKPELVVILDKMRGECGFPFRINSGFRTKEYNATLKDAVNDSAHTTGEAVDISITDSSKRMKIISSAFMNGIKRVGISPTFIHLDISKTLPSGVIWLY